MIKKASAWLLVGLGCAILAQDKSGKKDEVFARIDESAEVFRQIMNAPDKAIPQELLEKAECVIIVPGMKRAGFIVGGRYGKGVATCRTGAGWSGPSTVRVEGGSFGAQIGGGETDVVMVVMNREGAEKLMKSEFTLGGDAAAMAGPVGRSASAQTDALMHAQILSYSRSRGLFAGVSLEGATLRSDDSDNRKIYGSDVAHRDILTGKVKAPVGANVLVSAIKPHMTRSGEASRKK